MNTQKLTFTVIAFLFTAFSQAQESMYINIFRAPSTGLEYRKGSWSLHGGLYTTILDKGGKSTEFVKAGATFYYSLLPDKNYDRFQSYVSVAGMQGLNRHYEDKFALFLESGALYQLGKGFELRFGTGLLTANGRKPEINPTIGLSYSFKFN